MRIVSYETGFGRLEDDMIVPMGDDVVRWLGGVPTDETAPIPVASVTLKAPVPNPGKVICVGLNYRDHAKESGQPVPDHPVLFAKFANSVSGPADPIVVPPAASQIDYEAELGVVIGTTGARRLSTEQARAAIAGYTCVNDVSARDLQFRSSQWTLGKAIDTFLPMGPYLVTPDEIGDPQTLGIRCFVNDELRQSSNTSEMIFDVYELVSFVSQTITLLPGDVIATGTPFGIGAALTPPSYLGEGDTVRVDIDRVGSISNTVRSER